MRQHAPRGTLRRTQVLVVAMAALACAPRRPPFIEPPWGDAPAPYATEVTEITFEHRHCGRDAGTCTVERASLRRDGRAFRSFRTGSRTDSTQVGTIDSVAFTTMAEALRGSGFFARTDAEARHEPLATDSYLLSGATLCRRAVRGYAAPEYSGRPVPGYIAAIQAGISAVGWARCCGARL